MAREGTKPELGLTADVLRVELVTSPQRVLELRDAWDSLLEANNTRSHFLRWSWSRLWLQYYAPPDSSLYVLVCRDAAGQALGLAPFYVRPRRFAGFTVIRELNFIGTGVALRTSEHLDIIAAPGREAAVAGAFAEFLQSRSDWDRIWLWSVPARSPSLQQLQRLMPASVRSCDKAHYLPTEGDWETLRARWSKKFRYNTERSTRLLAKDHGLAFERVTTAAALQSALDDFVYLHQLRWVSKGHAGSFTLPRFEQFMRDAIRQAFDAGQLRFWVCRLDGECVATLVAFVEDGVAHYFQGGFDPAWAKHSLGSVMVAHCLQDCVADPEIREFDFMGGGSLYKDRWTDLTRMSMELECLRPGWRSSAYRHGARGWRSLRKLVRAVREWRKTRHSVAAAVLAGAPTGLDIIELASLPLS